MALPDDVVDERVRRYMQACRDAGVKLTPQRLEIFREIAASESHPDAEQVWASVSARLPSISLDTVYRTLWMLTRRNLVATLGPARDRTRFDANLSRHHHFVCSRCGLTRDFHSEELDVLRLPDSVAATVAAFGPVHRAQVEVTGICHACAEAEQAQNDAAHSDDETAPDA